MKKINLNKFSREITLAEGGKVNLSIAQVKEVLKLTFTELANEYKVNQILDILARHYKEE